MLSQAMKDTINIAISNMGETFTSHNIIDFMRSRPKYRKIYDVELSNHADEKALHFAIGQLLAATSKTADFELLGKIRSEDIHENHEPIGYYRRLNFSI